jgi:hypothetical protein
VATTSQHARKLAITVIAGCCGLVAVAYPDWRSEVQAEGYYDDRPAIPPQVEEELEPEVLDMLQKEARNHTNEAVLIVPLVGAIATFGNFAVLMRHEGDEEDNAASWSLFRDKRLIQTGDVAFNLDERTGDVDVTGTIENVRTGDRLVSEVIVAEDSSQPDGCSLITDGLMTVARTGTEIRSATEPAVTTHTVFDVCREVVTESSTDGFLPDDVIEQFEPGIGRTLARISIEESTIFPPEFSDFGLDSRLSDTSKLKCIPPVLLVYGSQLLAGYAAYALEIPD